MRIIVGSDERTHLTDATVEELKRLGHTVELCGALQPGDETLWPLVGKKLGEKVADRQCDQGVLFCYTGTGASIAANKVPGIRAALCADSQTASGAREYNDANVLVMSLRLTSPEVAKEILDAWFSTPPGGGEDAYCVEKVKEMDRIYRGAAPV